MKLIIQSPKKALKAFLKQRPTETEKDKFKTHLVALLDKMTIVEKQPKAESEEHLKNNLRDFLRDTYYLDTNAMNTKDKKDLVIHIGKTTDTDIAVIIETKRPANKTEMISTDNANKKALHELILYYFTERNAKENSQLKQLVITDTIQWFIFDVNYFDKYIYRNTQMRKLYDTKLSDKKDNPWFYEEIAKTIAKSEVEIPCVYFDLKTYEPILRSDATDEDKELVALYKILAPQYLLKQVTPNDSNALNERFYKELLYIIGLEEAKEGNKNIIRRKKENKNAYSLIELTIEALTTEQVFHRIPDIKVYGDTREEQIFNISLELCITWINRILFLKLLEGQLIAYHQGNKDYRFLHSTVIPNFSELFKLFHKVLAVNVADRTEAIKQKYSRVPYLNSSLFEISELEDQTIKINSLENGGQLEIINTTVLKDTKKQTPKLTPLEYLFQFLDAYDFASEGTEDWQKDNKQLINASVLGKVFEKINGYRDGSIFTPAFITMYMCRQTIRLAVVQKFNEVLATKNEKLFDTLEDVKNYTSRCFKTQDIINANQIINSLRICDPAVGSGHFLVSALNEIIAIKTELGILADDNGSILGGYEIEIINDELIITDQQGNAVEYKLQLHKPINKEVQRLQKTLFHEKQTIIENCLFGVDINPKSVLICRLRLWIELLKNAYYKTPTYSELETLPNIDINIKCGNSLVSRFALDADLSKALKSIKYNIEAYRGFVNDYKNEKNREVKKGLQLMIDHIKTDFKTEILKNDPRVIRLNHATGELFNLLNQTKLFDEDAKLKKARLEKQKKLETTINALAQEIENIKTNVLYKNAFEWRFEFPEVLNNNGDFVGFDLIIGNPPYIQLQSIKSISEQLKIFQYKTYEKTGDIYSLFYEKGNDILKDNGYLGYITSNKWMRAGYGKTTRNYFLQYTQPHLLIDLGSGVFEEATVDSNILIFKKQPYQLPFQALDISKEKNVVNLDSFSKKILTINPQKEENWTIANTLEQSIKAKIERIGKPLKEWDISINYGIKTGYNEAFIIDGKKKDELIAQDPNSAEIIKPILRGRDVKRYRAEFADLWLINTHNGVKGKFSRIEAENNYPAIYKHLQQFEQQLIKRLDKGYHWTNLRNCAYIEEFEKEKIIYPNMTLFLPFIFDNKNFYTNQKCFIITSKTINLKFLIGFLNSKISHKWIKNNCPELQGGTRELSKIFFENIPIPNISTSEQQPFIALVDKVLLLKEAGKDSSELEKEIDELVYKLYALTPEERQIVEGK